MSELPSVAHEVVTLLERDDVRDPLVEQVVAGLHGTLDSQLLDDHVRTELDTSLRIDIGLGLGRVIKGYEAAKDIVENPRRSSNVSQGDNHAWRFENLLNIFHVGFGMEWKQKGPFQVIMIGAKEEDQRLRGRLGPLSGLSIEWNTALPLPEIATLESTKGWTAKLMLVRGTRGPLEKITVESTTVTSGWNFT